MTLIRQIAIFIFLVQAFNLSAQDDFNKIDSLESIIEKQAGLEKAVSQRELSLLYYDKTYYEKSLRISIDALNYFEENGLDSTAMHVHNTIGSIYERTKQFDRAEEHYLKALNGFDKYHNDSGVLAIYLNLGVLFSSSSDFSKSEKYSLLAINKAKTIKDTFRLIMIYSNMSYNYFLDDQCVKSIESVDSGLYYINLCPKTERYLKRENALKVNLSENLVKLKRFDEALIVLGELLVQEKKLNLGETADLYRMLANTYEGLNLFDKALGFIKKEKYFSDSLNKAINNELLMELTIKNELKYKEQENELLLKEKELKLSEQKYMNNILGLGSSFLLVLSVLFGVFYLKTRKKNKQLVEANLEMLSNQSSVLPKISVRHNEKKSSEISAEQKQKIINDLNKAFNLEEVFKDESLTANSLSKKLNTNRNYLSIVIKEIHPNGFLDFVNEYRIRKSWTLLSNPDFFHLTIDHISKEVGFKSQPTFNKAFKKFTGVTPSFYLKEVKRNIN